MDVEQDFQHEQPQEPDAGAEFDPQVAAGEIRAAGDDRPRRRRSAFALEERARPRGHRW